MPKSLGEVPEQLRPYFFHRVRNLDWVGTADATADCPFCGKEGHLFISQETGQYQCKVCRTGGQKGGGNSYTFIRKLHEISLERGADYESITTERRIKVATLRRWGMCQSVIDGEWLFPTYGFKTPREVVNLYRWAPIKGKRRLISTATFGQMLFGLQFWDASKPWVYLCEGPFDAMALEEALMGFRMAGSKLVRTSDVAQSLYAQANILAVPGCEQFKEDWAQHFAGKRVYLLFDSDHPKTRAGIVSPPGGYEGMKSTTLKLRPVTQDIWINNWGPEGYDPSLPDGYDVRDSLAEPAGIVGVLGRLAKAPDDWLTKTVATTGDNGEVVVSGPPPLECRSYEELVAAWKEAMYWTDSLDVALSSIMAVVVSTMLQGSQIWLRLIGPPGSAKSLLCESITGATQYVKQMSILKGFHSGYNQGGEDCSIIPHMMGKTCVINEGDTLLKAPNRDQILSQLRDLYTGWTRNHYLNGKQEEYTGIRTTMLLAGTSSLRQLNKSALGDRFLDCVVFERVNKGIDQTEIDLVDAVIDMAVDRCKSLSNGDALTQDNPKKVRAARMSAGYVNYLRENTLALIEPIDVPTTIRQDCRKLGLIVARMRFRPDDKSPESESEVELGTRLGEQFIRLAICTAAVMGRSIDREVMRRVARLARDTCKGNTYSLCEALAPGDPLSARQLSIKLHVSEMTIGANVRILQDIGCVVVNAPTAASGAVARSTTYRLAPIVAEMLSKLRLLADAKPS